MMKIKLNIIIVSACLVVFIAGCGADSDHSATNQAQPQKSAPIAKPSVAEKVVVAPPPEAPFVYNSAGKRDPFVSLVTVRKPVAEQNAPLTPLQQYDLSQFRLIGAIVGKNEPQAMVEAPGGKPFIVKKGVLIGKNNGVVVDITSQKVVVEEKYYDFSGAVRKSLNTIEFPPKQGVN